MNTAANEEHVKILPNLRKNVSLPESLMPGNLKGWNLFKEALQHEYLNHVNTESSNVKFHERPQFRLDNAMVDTASETPELKKSTADFDEKAYTKVHIQEAVIHSNDPFFQEYANAAKSLLEVVGMRDRYSFEHSQYSLIEDLIENHGGSPEPQVKYVKEKRLLPKLENTEIKVEEGVINVYRDEVAICHVVPMTQYLDDLMLLVKRTYNSANKTFSYKRLQLLQKKFEMHLLYNREKEVMEQKSKQKRDFYKVRKVDTHVHHSAFMNINTLLKFIKKKAQTEPDKPVIKCAQTGNILTLGQVFEKYKLTPETLNVEILDMQAGFETYQRFDRFNKKYNPFSRIDFREIFLKSDNLISGQYLAEITKEVFAEFDANKYLLSEPRISVYGKSPKEWEKLADWFDQYDLYHHQVRWIIQIPRLYEVYKKAGIVENFQQMIDNIFRILFEVTINPESNPKLYKLLLQIVGFDSVDDESVYEIGANPQSFLIPPEQWNYAENPNYCYWAYYLWANVYSLNHLRKSRGLNSFAFRPHCGEAGSAEHLMGAFLLADGINHGIRLEKAPVLQYLFYLKQIGIAMSPLSNNKLFLKYKDNPLPQFISRGLNISLSTDDPLIFHMTHEPLMEEFSIASQVYNLSTCDLCELARNSVLQSGFEDIVKSYWIGKNYKSPDDGNTFEMTNLPNTRYLYRVNTLKDEFEDLRELAKVAH